MNSRASTNPPPPPTPISQFRRYYQQTYCYKSTHSIVTYLYSIQRLLHCNLSDIKEKMMHSYYSSIYNTTIFSIVKKTPPPHHSNDDPPPLCIFLAHHPISIYYDPPKTTKLSCIASPPPYYSPLPPTIRVRRVVVEIFCHIYLGREGKSTQHVAIKKPDISSHFAFHIIFTILCM